MERITKTISMLKGLDKETLEGWRYTLIFFIVIDMLLFYWFLKWKNFALALMVVCLILLAIILMLERKFPPEKEEGGKEEKSAAAVYNDKKLAPVMKNKEKKEGFMNMDLGLPDPEEYNERLEKAIST